MKIPEYLKKGDTVIIVATARKILKNELEPAIKELKSWGLKVELSKNIYKSENQFAGSDKNRADDLQNAINHKKAKAIIVARGGYGTIRIMDKVNFKPLKKLPKWIVGYSDITALHSCLHNLGLQSLHATMPINFFKNKEALQSLKVALFGNKLSYKIKPVALNRPGKASGQVIGGNLSLLYALSGCKEDLKTKNKILFIEDLDEYLYHIDRMMMQLKRSGKLKNLKALIVGGMTDMKDNKIPFGKTAEQIILEAVSEYKYPVCFNFPAGHIDRNLAIVFGKEASINITKTKVEFNYL